MKKNYQYILLFILFLGLISLLFSKLIFGTYIFISSDTLAPQAFKQSILNMKNNYGEFSYWFPYIFSGMPAIHSFIGISELYFPHQIINNLFNIFNIPWAWNFFIHYIFAGFGMYLLIQYFNQSRFSCFFGSILFMLNPYMVAYYVHGHGGQMMTACYIPWIMLFLLRIYKKTNFLNCSLFALMIGLQLQRGHIQIAYYTWLIIGIYILLDLIINIKSSTNISYIDLFKKKVSVLSSLFLGFLFSLNIYYPVMNYTPLSTRGMEAGGFGLEKATMWSFNFNEFITLILPYYYGFGGQLYSGYMPFTDFPNYIGIVVLLLSILGLYKSDVDRKYKIFFSIVIIVSLLLSAGKYSLNFYSLFYNYLPYFNKFRAPVFILILLYFCCSILASFGLNVISNVLKDKNHFLKILSVLFIVLIPCFYLKFSPPSYYPQHKIENNKEFIEVRQSFLKDAIYYNYDLNNDSKLDYKDNLILDYYLNNDAKVFYLSQYLINDNNNDGRIDKLDIQNIDSMQILSILKIVNDNVELYNQSYDFDINIIIMILFVMIVLFLLYSKNSLIPRNYLIVSIIIICIFDYYRINSEIIHTKNHIPNKHILKSKDYLDKYLTNDQAIDFLQSDNDKYRILDLTGSDRNRWAAFNIETIEGYHPAKLKDYNKLISNSTGYDYNLLYLTNVKYLISRQKHSNDYIKKTKMYYFGNDNNIDGKLIEVYIYKLENYYPRVFFVEDVSFNDSFDSVINKVKDKNFNPQRIAYIDTSNYSDDLIAELGKIKYDSNATIRVEDWSPDKIVININSDSPQLLFLSEIFYPGWKTDLDIEILKINGVFRGLIAPKGNYNLIIKFDSDDILFGYIFHLIAFITILLLLLLHKFYKKDE